MRARLIFIVLAIVLVGGFAALNWSEVMRTSHLNFGLVLADASLGGILLGALAITLLVFLVSSAIQESRNLIEWNRHSKALAAQRDLADRAEASRFTDLRQHIDTTLRETGQRESMATSDFEKSMIQGQRELRNHLEQMHRTMGNQMEQLESRIEAHLQRMNGGAAPMARTELPPVDTRVTDVPPRQRVNI